MRETYIDEIDNIKRIDAFVSYDEYVASAAFKEYASAHGIETPPRAVEILKERESAQEEAVAATAVEEKAREKKCNACAIVTAILSVGYIVWCLLGALVEAEINGFGVFVLFGGKPFVPMAKNLIGGEADIGAIAATCLVGVSMLGTLGFGVLGSLATVRKQKTSMAVTVGMLAVLFCGVAVGVPSIVTSRSTELGIAIAVLIALMAFTASAVGRRNKAKENG